MIEVEGLTKTFYRSRKSEHFLGRLKQFVFPKNDPFVAVDQISFRVAQGESVAFIGPNGAGKSTTIKMLTGILYPTSGRASVLGLTPWKDRKQLAFKIGTVFGQRSQLWMHLPPRDTFKLLSRIYELNRKDYEARVKQLVELFELQDFFDVPTRKLSLGQRMRCEVASSLLHKPKVIFLDEPTIGLDPVAKSTIRELISRANREEGVSVFLTSHDAGDIERLCKRVMIVNFGKIIFDDTTNRLKRDFLKKKEIDLKLSAPFDGTLDMKGVHVEKAKGFGVKLSVDTTQASMDEVVQKILHAMSVEDITIQNAPMEEIIADLYRSQNARGVAP